MYMMRCSKCGVRKQGRDLKKSKPGFYIKIRRGR